MKKLSVIGLAILLACQIGYAQNIQKEENMFKGMSLQEAQDMLERQISLVELMGAFGGLSFDNDDDTETYSVEEINSVAPFYLFDMDTIKINLDGFFSKMTFDQIYDLSDSTSYPQLHQSLSEVSKFIDNKGGSSEYKPVFTAKKIYFSDGSVSDVDLDFGSSLSDMRGIDSIATHISYRVPSRIRTLVLTPSNPIFEKDSGYIKLNEIEGKSAQLTVSDDLQANIGAVYARTALGNKLIAPNNESWSTGSSETMRDYMNEAIEISKKLIDNLKKNKYASVEELNVDYWANAPKAPESDRFYNYTFGFRYPITALELYLIEDTVDYNIDVVVKNNLWTEYSDVRYDIVTDEDQKMGIVDRAGRVIIEPQFSNIYYSGGIFFEIQMDDDDDDDQVIYRLDEANNRLIKCDFEIQYILNKNLLVVTPYDDTVEQMEGIVNTDGTVLFPLKEQKISVFEDEQLFVIRSTMDDKKATDKLYDFSGKQLLSDDYFRIGVYKGFVYAKWLKAKDKISVFDTNLKKISNDNWFDVINVDSNSGFFFVVDKDGTTFCADKKGNTVIKPSKDYKIESDQFTNGYCTVSDKRDNNKYGYIDTTGKVVIPMEYSNAHDFYGKCAYVEKGDEAMFIDANNKVHVKLPGKADVSDYTSSDKPMYYVVDGMKYDTDGNLVSKDETYQNKYTTSDFKLQIGDLIFKVSDRKSNMNQAIADATSGVDQYEITHVGIVVIYNDILDSVCVIEATHPKVTITPLNKYLTESNGVGIVGRLHDEYQPLIDNAIEEAILLFGKEYDDAFDIDNDKYYCSELIYEIFLRANNGTPVFPLSPMSFKSKETGETSPYWVEHFEKLGIPIPEGKLGNNPGAMSQQSDLLDIVHIYK